MSDTTRTAAQAADACGCAVEQIVKSLVFAKPGSDHLVLLLVAGDRQVDVALASEVVGAKLERASPDRVREMTGFAIGGVSPIGHLHPIPVFIDANLLDHQTVWAAAGAPDTVFEIDPGALRKLVNAQRLPVEVCRRS